MATFKYKKICDEIIRSIENGTLVSGDKLDSIRLLAQKRGIGVSTATHVYTYLERLGWIYSIEKTGFFVNDKKQLTTHTYGATFISSKQLAKLPVANAVLFSFNDPEILPLSCTAPSTVIDAEQLLSRFHRKSLRSRPYKMLMQNPIDGLAALRAEIAKHYLKSGQVVDKNDILITNGRKDGLMIAIEAFSLRHECIAIESPCSYFFQSILSQLKLRTIAIPQQVHFLDEIDLLEQAFQAEPFKAYVFNPNFNDPTGRVLSIKEKQTLIQWAEERNVILIEYDRGDLHFGHQRPPSTVSLLDAGSSCEVMSINDFYDTVSPTISLGFIVCKNTLEASIHAKQIISEEPNITLQYMFLEMFKSGEYFKFLNKVRLQLALQCKMMLAILDKEITADIYISEPAGGPCLWLALPQGMSSEKLWQYTIEHNIAIAPGSLFLNANVFEHYFRITFGLPWNTKMEQGVKKLAKLINQFLSNNNQIKD